MTAQYMLSLPLLVIQGSTPTLTIEHLIPVMLPLPEPPTDKTLLTSGTSSGAVAYMQAPISRIIKAIQKLYEAPSFDARVVGKLCSYLTYERDWDGEGAEPPAEDAIFAAMAFLQMVPAEVDMPKVMALPTGEIAFYWDRDQRYAEIGFDETGKLYAYGTHPTLAPVHLDNQTVNEAAGTKNFPEPIRVILTTDPAVASA